MKKILIIAISILTINQVIGQANDQAIDQTIGQATGQASEQIILDKFFQLYKAGSDEAIDYIYSTTKWVDSEGDGVKQLKSQLKQYNELVGEYHGEEFIHRGYLGESFATYVYLAKYDRQPFRFTFEFYKPKDSWILYSFSFDDDFDDDFEEILKYEYLRNPFR